MTTTALSPTATLGEAYQHKPMRYFAGARNDFIRMLPHDPTASILEVGCGTGATGALALSRGRAGRYVGIELFDDAAAVAKGVLSEVLTGDVETMALSFRPATFDAVIMSEVLEHLVDPGRVLKRLAPAIRQGGLVLASSPNVSHWRVIREIAMGRFNLADQGVFDRTHLRWFTPDSYARMFSEAGYKIEHVGPVTPFSPRTSLLSRWSDGRLDHLFMTQILLVASKR